MQIRSGTFRAFRPFILISVLAMLAAGCAAARPVKTVERFWPVPPDPPRIAYVRSLSEPEDLGRKRNWFLLTFQAFLGGGPSPPMLRPFAVTADDQGKVYIADTGEQAVHIYDLSGRNYHQIYWIQRGQSRFLSPTGVAVDGEGNVFVSDSQLNRIFEFSAKGYRLIRTIGEPGEFDRLGGLAYDKKNKRLLAAEANGHRIHEFDAEGKLIRSFGKRGVGDGEFNFPADVATDKDGNIYVTDSMNFRIQIFDENFKFIRKFGRLGAVLGTFSKPKGVAVDTEGHIYVVDGIYDTVQIFDNQGRLLMNFGTTGEGPGDFWLPNGIAIDGDNRIYVADTYNHRVQVFQFLGSPTPEEAQNVRN
jgi:DNA-binding beta-propeller fold protein YncE